MQIVPIHAETEFFYHLLNKYERGIFTTILRDVGAALKATFEDQVGFLRDAGVKRIKLTGMEERRLGKFVKGESYSDSPFLYHWAHYEKGAILFSVKDGMTNLLRSMCQFKGMDAEYFRANSILYLRIIGFEEDGKEYTLEDSGMDKASTALYGRCYAVDKFVRGDDYIWAVWYKSGVMVVFPYPGLVERIVEELNIDPSILGMGDFRYCH